MASDRPGGKPKLFLVKGRSQEESSCTQNESKPPEKVGDFEAADALAQAQSFAADMDHVVILYRMKDGGSGFIGNISTPHAVFLMEESKINMVMSDFDEETPKKSS